MQLMTESISQIYYKITNMRRKYADLKKCEIHLHTPASYDYVLIDGQNYESIKIEKILNYAKEIGYLAENQLEAILDRVDKGDYEGLKYIEQLKEKNIPYKDFKEYLSYMLIAYKLYLEKVEVVVISDHNTLTGFKKLKYALDEYFKNNIKTNKQINQNAIHLLLGIEISCSDKNHVIGIFDQNNFTSIEKFVNEQIHSAKEGTIETSLTIIKEISKLGGVGYLAHITSSDFLGTKLYKQNLFSKEASYILGSTNLENMDKIIEEKIYPFTTNREFCILHEGDSHSIETIGRRNTWIKFNKLNFSAFKKALIDYHFSVYTEKPTFTDKFIKGIYIHPGDNGYMSGNRSNDEFFKVDFSKDLNCIIGGRGTGKSTLLNIIDTIFSRTSPDKKQLKFISNHKFIVIVFAFHGNDYIVKFIPQLDPDKEYYQRDFFLEKAFLSSPSNQQDTIYLAEHWLELYKVEDSKNFRFIKVIGDEKNDVLNSVYRNRYSINNILNRINRGEIGEFVREVIFDGLPSRKLNSFLKGLINTNKKTIRKYLKDNLNVVINELEIRKEKFANEISDFNQEYKDLIKIEYGHYDDIHNHFIDELLFNIPRDRHVNRTLLTWEGVERYLYEIINKVNFIQFFNLLVGQKFADLEKLQPLSQFANKRINRSIRDINEEYQDINKENINSVYRDILKELVSNNFNLHTSFKRYIEITDNFNLLFNVNSKESFPNQGVLLKPIESLSLGQKVAAILTFIFKFGIHAKDNTPLIIDQPEDNLDSQYIYKNLVSSLRNIKNSRQVIIVTHNSTIVTNAVAEQVIVLNSDNRKGWVEHKGYLGNQRVTKLILQYLEGGKDSFLHKMDTYNTILNLRQK